MSTPTRERYGPLPSAIIANTVWTTICDNIPVMLIHPDRATNKPAPLVLWMHGRTVQKEIDPGRYLRLMRAGIAVCAIDLPGHGERYDEKLQSPDHIYQVISKMTDEIDGIVSELQQLQKFSITTKIGIGGMSGGGMVTLARLCKPHNFTCASVEATTGSWQSEHFPPEASTRNPIENLNLWPEIPFQAFHARHDEWVKIETQRKFITALKTHYQNPNLIEFIEYDRTGAPNEHAGFGRFAADAKNAQRDFFVKHLLS